MALCATTALVFGGLSLSPEAKKPQQSLLPDFYFVLTDDLGVGGVGYNNPELRALNVTPHLDAMAAEGIKLTSHYT